MKDGLITINERGGIDSFNSTAENLFGYSQEEILGENVNSLMSEPYRSQHDKYVDRYLKTGEAHILGIAGIEVEGRKKDGTTFPISITISEMFLSGKRFFSRVIRDMTAKIALERERELVVAELSQLIDTANAPIIGLNKRLQINEWNQSAAATTGYGKEEVLDWLFFDELVREDHKVAVRKVFDDALQGIATASFDLILTTKQGRDLNILLNASTRRNINVDVTGIIGVGQDVTELRVKEKRI